MAPRKEWMGMKPSKRGRTNKQKPCAAGGHQERNGSFSTSAARFSKAGQRAARPRMFKEGRGRMRIAGALPAAIRGAENKPWSEQGTAGIERQAITALQMRSSGVPFAVGAPTLPAAADPRFKIDFSAIERRSREVRANACANGRGFHGLRRVPKDALKPRELADK